PDLQREPALGEEQWREGPATSEVTEHSALRLLPRRGPHQRRVIGELHVKVLRAVIVVQVEGVGNRQRAGGLWYPNRAQGASPSEIGEQRHAVPVVGFQRPEQRVVVAV